MATLNIKIGASVDRNLGVAYRPFVEGAKKAAASVDAELRRSARAIQRDTEKAEKEKAKAIANTAKETVRQNKQAARDAEKAKKDEVKAFERAEKEKTKIATSEAKARTKEETAQAKARAKEETNQAKAAARDAARIAKEHEKGVRMVRRQAFVENRDREVGYNKAAKSIAGGLAGIGRAGVSKALSITAGLARANGVDFSAESAVKKNADLETTMTNLSNSAYMPNDPRNSKRVNPKELMNEALDIGMKTGTSANEVGEGLAKFVGLTGDLRTGREVMVDLLKLSKATGTEFSDMAAAAGNVAANLPESANKGKQVESVMRAIAGQGKMGAVEIKDLATQMAKLAAQAGQFQDKNVDETITTLGVMAQMSRAKGGSPSAREAAGSISSFVGMLKTKRRAEEFEKATGVQVFDKKSAMLRDPMTIIKEALSKKGMDPIGLKTIFQNMQGGRAVEGWATIYRQAGGGKKGLDAVDAEFTRLKNATMSAAEVEESFARSMKTGQSQAEVFNQQMQKSALAMQDALLPAVQSLAPMVVSATGSLSSFITAMVGPGARTGQIAEDTENARSLMASARKQEAGGNISETTQAEMAKAERDLKSKALGAESDEKDAKKNVAGGLMRAARTNFDYSIPGLVLSAIGGGSAGHGLGEAMNKTDDAELQQKGYDAKNSRELYQEMVQANKTLHEKLDRGIVVTIKNVDEMRAKADGDSSPKVDATGRQPAPGQKKGR